MPPETKGQLIQRIADRLFGKPIIQNQFRSTFVEAMIEPYLAEAGWRYVGNDWRGWDFEREGQRLEVKQSARVQSWSFGRQMLTRPIFDIAPRTGYFYESGATWVDHPGRCADVFVFAWHGVKPSRPLAEGYPHPVDQGDVTQWVFYVLRTGRLPPTGKTISLTAVENKLHIRPVIVDKLAAEVKNCISM